MAVRGRKRIVTDLDKHVPGVGVFEWIVDPNNKVTYT